MIEREQLLLFATRFFRERMEQSKQEIVNELSMNRKKYREELLEICNRLFQKAYEINADDVESRWKYLHFFILRSAMLTGEYEIQIQLFPREEYLCKTELWEIWYPEFIMKHFRDDMEVFEEKARKEIIQYCYQDRMKIMERYYPQYLMIVKEFIVSVLEAIVELDSFQKLEKEEEFAIRYGGYMEQGEITWQIMNT